MLEIHELTGDQAYFDRAERTMRFVLSGGDSKLGDGLYWRETPRATKNTCTNAPAIVGLLRLHQVTKDDSYLVRAKQLYAWVNAHLQDPDDGLLWDNINLESRVDERKYSYNTALMIRANCLLHEIEKDPAYLKQANRLAEAAVQRWIDRDSPAVADSGAFAHLLIEALLAVDRANGAPRWRQQAEASVRFVHDHLRGTQGRYPARWDGRRDRNTDRMKLLDQASVARAFFVVAQAQSATDD
jgi:uncharacterized protein YyaL (SSP411 family)